LNVFATAMSIIRSLDLQIDLMTAGVSFQQLKMFNVLLKILQQLFGNGEHGNE